MSTRSFFALIADVLRTWEDALDVTTADYALARIHALESEVDHLKAELARRSTPQRSIFGESWNWTSQPDQ